MQRSQWIAALVVILVASGLLANRVQGDESNPIEAAQAAGSEAAAEGESLAPTSTVAPIEAPENLGPAGTLRGLDGWLQTDATSFEDFDGEVRIVQFWTFGCYNCRNTLPHLKNIYERWEPEGLEIIGVHAAEFDFEKDPDAIAEAAVKEGITWPIALDTEKRNFWDWQPGRRFWPRTFVVDQNGDIRFDRIGEGRYIELEATVAYLLENGP